MVRGIDALIAAEEKGAMPGVLKALPTIAPVFSLPGAQKDLPRPSTSRSQNGRWIRFT